MRKALLSVLLVFGTVFPCAADSWSAMLRAYKMDVSALVRGNGYQIFRSEAGGLGIAYSETDASGECHFSLAMVPMDVKGLRWLPHAGAAFLEIKDYGDISGVMALQEVEGPDTDPRLGSFIYVIEPRIKMGPDARILNLGYYADKLVFLIERNSGVLWVGEDGKKIDIPAANPVPVAPSQPLRIEDTRVVDIGLSVFWADRNVGADTPQAYGDYFPFGTAVPWGGAWRTPTASELQELLNKCSWEMTVSDGVKGYKVTGPNGNAIFLPLGGSIWDDGSLDRPGECGSILSSERPAGQFYIDYGYFFHLQMTLSDGEEYRHYLRTYNIGRARHNLRPVMPKP